MRTGQFKGGAYVMARTVGIGIQDFSEDTGMTDFVLETAAVSIIHGL